MDHMNMNMNMNMNMPHLNTWQQAGFWNLWSPLFFMFLVLISLLYLAITGRLRERFGGKNPATSKQKFLFFLGIFLLYVAFGSPIDYYGHHFMFSSHMLEQSILYFMIPPLILMGIPDYVLRTAFQYNWIKKLLVINPIFATVFFNGVFSFYHYPLIFNTIMENMLLMNLSHTVLLISAFQMWWHISCPVQELERISGLRKIGYIFLSGILLTPACALIIFAGSPIYNVYAQAPQVLFSIMDDQQLGGVLMKIIQEIAYGISLTFAFFEWYRKENPVEDLVGTGGSAEPTN